METETETFGLGRSPQKVILCCLTVSLATAIWMTAACTTREVPPVAPNIPGNKKLGSILNDDSGTLFVLSGPETTPAE